MRRVERGSVPQSLCRRKERNLQLMENWLGSERRIRSQANGAADKEGGAMAGMDMDSDNGANDEYVPEKPAKRCK